MMAEQTIRITARTAVGYEYHLDLPASLVRGIIDPDVPDRYIEVPVPQGVQSVKHRYLHTSRIAETDLHDDLSEVSDQ